MKCGSEDENGCKMGEHGDADRFEGGRIVLDRPENAK